MDGVANARTRGHLFVLNGRVDRVLHDAAIIPVDKELDFNEIWRPLFGARWPREPATWHEGWGRVQGRDQWIVEVGDGDYAKVLGRITLIIEDIARSGLKPAVGRELLLVAIPVVGIGRGGHAHEKGRVVRDLVGHLAALASDVGVDIGLVSPDIAVYSAAQYARRGEQSVLTDVDEQEARDLGAKAKRGQLALFIGAGVSMGAGLPSWNALIELLSDDVLDSTSGDLSELTPTDRAELIERADRPGFQGRVAALVREHDSPGLLHALLAGLDARETVTTNYDLLYERAVEASGRSIASVMPWASALGADRWILKLHGDVEHEQKIVLTRRHMVRYDAANRPSAAVLQSLFLTRHLLVVGASLTDDNFIRLAHEVQIAPRGVVGFGVTARRPD